MRTMIIAAVAAMGLAGGVAYAGDAEEPVANTLFTQIPGVVAQVPVGLMARAFCSLQLPVRLPFSTMSASLASCGAPT